MPQPCAICATPACSHGYRHKCHGSGSAASQTPNMLKQIVLVCGIALMQCYSAAAIECYTCTNTSSLPDCKHITKCPTNSVCASEYTTINGTRLYNLGCRDLLSCHLTPTATPGSPSIVGRSVTTSANCSECCHANYCNRQICQDPDPQCADDKSVDCASVGTITNICDDASHIKPYCRRFCGFCDTVDGGWSHWSQWSLCSMTCGNGTRARARTCSDPPPANGGTDCPGVTHEQEPCSKDLCPIHGGWSTWSDWGACSASCDFGLKGRDRTCSNPRPDRNGEHCYGNPHEDMLCFPGACANGSWSSWSAWGACTRSCGGGIKTRGRQCNNPAPSTTGSYCDGDPMHAEACSISPCHAIGFSVKRPKQSPTPGQLTFTSTITNAEGSFNTTTGVFTCKTPGYYYFSVSLVKSYSYSSNAFCRIVKNGADLVWAYTYPGASPHKGYTAAVGSTYVHLAAGDTVTLAGCSPISSIDSSYASYNGFLVTPDAA